MRTQGRWQQTLALVLALAAVALPAPAETVALDPANALKTTLVLLETGRSEQALAFAEALLQRDPHSSRVLSLKSRALRNLGRYEAAEEAARLAWRHAGTGAERFDAAMVRAQALASGEAKFRAQFWLRRAIEDAPDDATRRMAERDFAYVRTRSRLSLRFDVSIQPSSNVNNGSSQDTLWFYGYPLSLSGDAQALSGTKGTFGVTLKYRLAETEHGKTDLRLGVMQTLVTLSGEAQAQAPEADGADYTFAAAEIGLERTWRPFKGGEALVAGTLGHNSYGGAPMSDYARLDLGLSKTVTRRLSFKGSLSLEHQARQDYSLRSADVWTLGIGVVGRAANADRIALTLTFGDTRSDSVEVDHGRLRVQADWDHARPILGARLSLGVWAEARNYAQSRYSPDGREDASFGAELALAYQELDYMGFIPVMTLSGSNTDSNIGLYDTRSLGVGFSIRSKF